MIDGEEERRIARLRKAVITMGYMLFFGTIALFVAVVVKFSIPDKGVNPVAVQAGGCQKGENTLQVNEEIKTVHTEANIITIVTAGQIIIFDYCKGEVLSRIMLTR